MRSGSRKAARLAAWIWPLVILAGSSLPGTALPPVAPGLDFLVHFLEYGVWGVFLAWGGYPAARAIGFGVAFALFDEAHQYGIPGRTPSLVDGCLDVLGLAAGWCAARGGR